MRLLKNVLALALFGLLLVGCKSAEQVAADKEAAEKDLAALAGTWRLTDQAGATSDPDEKEDDAKKEKMETGIPYTFEKDMLKIQYPWGPVYYKLTLNPGKEPKQVDMLLTEENGKAIMRTVFVKTGGKKKKVEYKEKKREDKRPGIYKIDGDTLTICFNWAEKDRPEGFTAPAETGRVLWTLKKSKDGAAPEKDKEKSKDKE